MEAFITLLSSRPFVLLRNTLDLGALLVPNALIDIP